MPLGIYEGGPFLRSDRCLYASETKRVDLIHGGRTLRAFFRRQGTSGHGFRLIHGPGLPRWPPKPRQRTKKQADGQQQNQEHVIAICPGWRRTR